MLLREIFTFNLFFPKIFRVNPSLHEEAKYYTYLLEA